MFLNTFKTMFFLTLLTLLFMLIGSMVGGQSGAIIALVIAGVMNFVSYWFSDKIVLKMYGAQEITYNDAPRLFNLVQRLAQNAQLPTPRVYIIPSDTPNAFATGRNPENGAVAVTQGIMNRLSEDELAGVIGHELAHIKNRDILISTIVATIAGAIAYIAQMAQWAAIFGGFGRSSDDEDRGGSFISTLFLAILAPILATIIQLAVSRSREFLADRVGAEISGQPMSLANALIKLENANHRLPMEPNQATAHMFIVSPLTGGGLMNLFRTHPTTEQRVARLKEFAATQGVLAY
ncbi:zinc metalloprotease HtpX [bacterium]|nr:zinc metalloprotease HtpX [bacterium]